MNDTARSLIEKNEEKVNKIRSLNIFLTELLQANKWEILEEKTKKAMEPIIEDVMEKINQISRQ